MKELHITKTGGGFLPCASIIEKGSDAAAWAFYQPVEPSGAASRLLAGLIALIRVEPGRNELAPETASAAEQGTAAHQRGNGAATLRVLIAEDDPSARTGLMELVRAWGYDTTGAVDGDDALAKVDSEQPDIVLADLVMPRRDGLSLLRALGDRLNELTFVMITAQGSVDSAVTAVKEGAYDYLTKPIDPQRLRVLLEKTVERHDTLRQVAALKRQLLKSGRFGRTIGSSPAIREVYQLIERDGASRSLGARVGRVGHREGARRPHESTSSVLGWPPHSLPSTAQRFPRVYSKVKSSVMSAAHSLEQSTAGMAVLNWRTRERCFSTKWLRWRPCFR